MAEEQQQEEEGAAEQQQTPAEEAAPNIDSEVAVLEQLKDGSALRHSLDPAVSDFSGSSPEETYAALAKWHAQGLVDSTVPNPDFAEDGVQFRWQINFLGLEYLEQRGQEDKTPEEIHEEKTALTDEELAELQKKSLEQLQKERAQRMEQRLMNQRQRQETVQQQSEGEQSGSTNS